MRKQPSAHLRILLVCAVTVFIMGAMASAQSQGRTSSLHLDGATNGVTLMSMFTLPSDPDKEGFEGAWLAGLSSEDGNFPDALAVTLSKQQSGWITVWGIQLYSAQGLLPSGRQTLAGTGLLSGGRFVDLYWLSGAPKWGHTFETWLSYDASSGVAAVWIYDVTDGSRVYQGQFAVGTAEASLQPVFGTRFAGDVGRLDEAFVHSAYLPRGITWGLEIAGEQVTAVDRSLGGATLRVRVPGTMEGSLRFVLEDADEGARRELLSLDEVSGEQTYTLPTADWVPGPSKLVMEAVHQGQVVFRDELALDVGQVAVTIDRNLTVEDIAAGPVLRGSVNVASDGWMPSTLNLVLAYDLRKPVQTVPLHDGWRNIQGEVIVPLKALSVDGPHTERYAFEIPLAALAADVTRGELFIEWSPRLDAPITLDQQSSSRMVVGDRLTAFPQVGDYMVLRADLHTHTTHSHDGSVRPHTRVWESYMFGFDVLALTEHKNMLSYPEVKDFAEEIGLVLVRGMETGLGGREEFVVLGLDEEYRIRDEHGWALVPGKMQVFYQDQVKTVIDHGGLFIYAHPGYPVIGGDHPEADAGWTEPIAWMIENGYLHGIEVRGYAGRNRDVPYRWALEHNLAIVDVTDIHGPRNFSQAFETPHALILATDASPGAVLDAIRDARTLAVSNGQLRGAAQWVEPLIDAVLSVTPTEQNGAACVMLENQSGLLLQGLVQTGRDTTWRRLFLPPFNSSCIPWDGDVGSVTVRFSNVWVGPGETLERTWQVE